MTEFVFAYVTAKDREEALSLGRTLVEKKLAACVNVFGGMTSVYRWKGKIETAEEAVLVVKTTATRMDEVTRVVKALHSYECPCVVQLSVDGGSPDYLEWLRESLQA